MKRYTNLFLGVGVQYSVPSVFWPLDKSLLLVHQLGTGDFTLDLPNPSLFYYQYTPSKSYR